MNIYLTSDPHYGHDGIIKFNKRPFESTEEMDEVLIDNWNNTMEGKSLVYIVGDFAWKNHNKYLSRLKGKKILIKGNHDKMPLTTLNNFTEVHDLLTKKIDDKVVTFCHYCMHTWDRSCYGSWHVHGHAHGRIKESGNIPRCDVGVDVWDYKPVPWEILKKKLEKRKYEFRGNLENTDFTVENREANLVLLNQHKIG